MVDYGKYRNLIQHHQIFLQFGSKGATDGQLNNPCGVTVYCDKMYVADCSNKRISVFQADDKFCICVSSDKLSGPHGEC